MDKPKSNSSVADKLQNDAAGGAVSDGSQKPKKKKRRKMLVKAKPLEVAAASKTTAAEAEKKKPETHDVETAKPAAPRVKRRTEDDKRDGQGKLRLVAPPPVEKVSAEEAVPALAGEEEDAAEAAFDAKRNLPPLFVSMAVHALILILLGLYTIAFQPSQGTDIVEVAIDNVEPLEMAKFEAEPVDEPVDDQPIEFEEPQEPLMDKVDEPEVDVGLNLPETELAPTPMSSLDRVLSSDQDPLAKLSGIKVKLNSTAFFGSKAKGKKFVFVVDNSNSMTGGRFETAVEELIKTVNKMGYDQQFYVMFFSDTAYGMFHPQAARTLVPASDRNKQRLAAWLYTVELCLKTKGKEAVQKAISMKPDAIYILGDGAFTDNTTQLMNQAANRRIPIHCVGMEVKARGKQQLTSIAKATKGTYRFVRVTPTARKAAMRKQLKRNRTRGEVWGVALPKGKGPMKKKKRKSTPSP